jgi:hypothetical protein
MDTFGNLEDWGKVLGILEGLKGTKKLDEHQSGLARILRYGENWRLLETVLEYAKEIVQPSEEFLKAICNVMDSRGIYLEARVLAVDALECLVPRMSIDHGGDNEGNRPFIIRKMKGIQDSTEPPKIQEAITRCLKIITQERRLDGLKES